MKILRKILIFPYALYLSIRYDLKTLWIASELSNQFMKLVNMVKSSERPVLMKIEFEGTKYTCWLGEYEHPMLQRLDELSIERNKLESKIRNIQENTIIMLEDILKNMDKNLVKEYLIKQLEINKELYTYEGQN
jgi:hypothetical protein